MPEPLEPARIVFDAAGAPFSADFRDVYHSVDGGPEQSRHVFLAGNALPQRWQGRRSFTVLETGFGLGLNFLCCAAALLEDPRGPLRLNYVAVEKHPPRAEDLARAHAPWKDLGGIAPELRRAWPPPVPGFHRIDLAAGRIGLTLLFGEAAEMLAEVDAGVDAIFLDGFAPAKNPAIWSDPVLGELARLSAAGTTVATWTVAAAVRAGLEAAGFRVDKRPGFGRKREMLTAVREGSPGQNGAGAAHGRHAIVIGAGLAGSWTAHALARRGWTVDVIERQRAAGLEASGNRVGAVRPAVNLADNVNARLARAAFLHATRTLAHDPGWEGLYARTGLLHVATTPERAQRMAAILAAHAFPHSYLRALDAQEAARLAGQPVAGPAWWMPDAGWARPQPLCDALLGHRDDRIRIAFGVGAHALEHTANGWRVLDGGGRVLAEAPILVAANGREANRLGLPGLTQLVTVRGQVSFLPRSPRRPVGIVVGGDGYIAPLPGGGHCVGATFEPGSTALDMRAEDHAHNLARAQRMLPGFAAGLDAARLDGWAGLRTATSDRLPACGPIDADDAAGSEHGRYVLTGLGARGLIWAPLCAEAIASQLEGEPNPVERSLLTAMDPCRGMHARPNRHTR